MNGGPTHCLRWTRRPRLFWRQRAVMQIADTSSNALRVLRLLLRTSEARTNLGAAGGVVIFCSERFARGGPGT